MYLISDQLTANSDYLNLVTDKLVSQLRAHTPDDENRFSKLLLRLSPLRSVVPDVIEEIFFTGLIGKLLMKWSSFNNKITLSSNVS